MWQRKAENPHNQQMFGMFAGKTTEVINRLSKQLQLIFYQSTNLLIDSLFQL